MCTPIPMSQSKPVNAAGVYRYGSQETICKKTIGWECLAYLKPACQWPPDNCVLPRSLLTIVCCISMCDDKDMGFCHGKKAAPHITWLFRY